MSKEREAKPVMSLERFLYEHSTRAEYLLREWQEKYAAPSAHYQPLLDAKDAEIKLIEKNTDSLADENTTLKALLEQAREVINDLCDLLDGECEEDKSGNLSEDCAHVIAHLVVAEQCIDAINAATGEK